MTPYPIHAVPHIQLPALYTLHYPAPWTPCALPHTPAPATPWITCAHTPAASHAPHLVTLREGLSVPLAPLPQPIPHHPSHPYHGQTPCHRPTACALQVPRGGGMVTVPYIDHSGG